MLDSEVARAHELTGRCFTHKHNFPADTQPHTPVREKQLQKGRGLFTSQLAAAPTYLLYKRAVAQCHVPCAHHARWKPS